MALFAVGGALKLGASLAPNVLPARMFSSGGRGAPRYPGFNATMRLTPTSHFFTDSRGHEWGWAEDVGHLDPLGGMPKPYVYRSSVLGTSVDYASHARSGREAPAYVVRDLESLLQGGRVSSAPAAAAPVATDCRAQLQQALQFIYYSGRCR